MILEYTKNNDNYNTVRQVVTGKFNISYNLLLKLKKNNKILLNGTSTYLDKEIFNGDIITSPRSQVYFLATEYGVINMEGRSTWERAEGLISIAHPDFRDELIKEAEKRKIWRRSNKR